MAHIWGQYADSDTERGIGQYEHQGLRLHTPNDIQSLDFPELRQVVQACSDLLDSTYRRSTSPFASLQASKRRCPRFSRAKSADWSGSFNSQ